MTRKETRAEMREANRSRAIKENRIATVEAEKFEEDQSNKELDRLRDLLVKAEASGAPIALLKPSVKDRKRMKREAKKDLLTK